MFQNKKMIVILVAIMGLSIMANWKYFFKEEKEAAPVTITAPNVTQRSPVASQAQRPVTEASGEADDEQLPEKKVDYQRMLVLARGKNWGSDPFGFSPKAANVNTAQDDPWQMSGQMSGQIPGQTQGKSGELLLESILITPFQSLAVINNQLLTEGDVFQGTRISKITENSVIMERKGVLRELKMKEHSIPTVYIKTPAVSSTQREAGE